MLHQWLLAEPLPEHSTLCCLWQNLHHVWWQEETFGPSITEVPPLKSTNGNIITDKGKTDEEVGRTLPGTLLEEEHCHWLNCKACKKTALLHHFHELLLHCWEEGTVPQDMCDANIITLYKNNGDPVPATTIVESPSLALFGRPLPASYWAACRCLLSTFTQMCSVDSGLEDQQST